VSEKTQTIPDEIKKSTYFLGIIAAVYDIIVAAVSISLLGNFTNIVTEIILGFVTIVLFNLVYMGLARGLDEKARVFRILFIIVMIFRIFDRAMWLVSVVGAYYDVFLPSLRIALGYSMYFVVSGLLFNIPLLLMLILFAMSKRLANIPKLVVVIFLSLCVLKIFVSNTVTAILFDVGLIILCVQRLMFPNLGETLGSRTTRTVATGTVATTTSTPRQPGGETKPSTAPAVAESTGLIRGLPILTYWCDKCNKPLTTRGLKIKGMTKDEISKPHNCPTCSTTLKAFWLPFDRKKYAVFVLTLMFFASTLWISMLPETILGDLNVYAAGCVLAGTIVCAVVFILLAFYWYRTQPKLAARPENATEIPPLAPLDRIGREMMFLLLFVIVGSLAIFGIFWAISFG